MPINTCRRLKRSGRPAGIGSFQPRGTNRQPRTRRKYQATNPTESRYAPEHSGQLRDHFHAVRDTSFRDQPAQPLRTKHDR